MEESKQVPVIFAVDRGSKITEADVKEYLEDQEVRIEEITSPKGFKVFLDNERAAQLLDKGEDTLKDERVNFAEDDAFCTLFVRGITEKVEEKELAEALSIEGKICMTSFQKTIDQKKPTGTAFVRFNKKEDALKAAKNHKTITVNGILLE